MEADMGKSLRYNRVILVSIMTAQLSISSGARAQTTGGGPCMPIIDHTELTQAMQLGHGATPFEDPELFPPMQLPPIGGPPLPEIPLIDGRSTALRIYVKEPSNGANCDFNGDNQPDIGGHMLVEAPGSAGWLVPGVLAGAASKATPNDLIPPWDRNVEESTINFTFLPIGASSSDRVISVTSCVGLIQSGSQAGWGILTRHCVKQEVPFVARRRPLFGGVPIDSTFVEKLPDGDEFPALGPPNSNSIAIGIADRHLWATWPFADDPAVGGGYVLFPDLAFKWNYCARNNKFGEDNCGITDRVPPGYPANEFRATPVLDKLAEINCAMLRPGTSSKADYLYGWFRQPAVASGRASRGQRVAIGDAWDGLVADTRTVYAHENGHLFGAANRPNGVTTGDVGWDVLGRTSPTPFGNRYVRSDEFDIMGEGDQSAKWVSADNYLDVLGDGAVYQRNICGRPASDESIALQSILPIHARIPQDPNQSAVIHPAIKTWAEADTSPLTLGDVELHALDALGNSLYSTRAFSDETGRVFAPIPSYDNLNEVRFLVDGAIRSTIVRSMHAPVVSIVEPAATTVLTETLTISWQQSDADDDSLVANVLYSPNHTAWYPIGARLSEQILEVSTDDLPASVDAEIQIRVSDGLNTTIAQVTGLQLGPNRSPSIQILSPMDGGTVSHRDNVVFTAQSYDPEDGPNWNSQVVHWTSSIDGALGMGLSANFDALSVGTHLVTVTTTDSEGESSSDSLTVVVQP